MKIEHVAIWVNDLEKMKNFYESYFYATSNEKYVNEKKGFESYFLTFESGARLELMRKSDISKQQAGAMLGWAHIAISVGSKEKVDEMTAQFKQDGYQVVNGPRTTGDGYYESVIEDYEGNLIEITI